MITLKLILTTQEESVTSDLLNTVGKDIFCALALLEVLHARRWDYTTATDPIVMTSSGGVMHEGRENLLHH